MPKLKTILVMALIGGVIYCAAMIVPHYFDNYQFQDDLASIAKFDAPMAKSDDDIRALVMKKVKSYDLPITEEQINVTREEGGKIDIDAAYTVTVNLLPNKSVVLKFNPASVKGSTTSPR